MFASLLLLFRTAALRARHRRAFRRIRVIESMDLPEELKKAAIARVLRRFEEYLDRFTRAD